MIYRSNVDSIYITRIIREGNMNELVSYYDYKLYMYWAAFG